MLMFVLFGTIGNLFKFRVDPITYIHCTRIGHCAKLTCKFSVIVIKAMRTVDVAETRQKSENFIFPLSISEIKVQ